MDAFKVYGGNELSGEIRPQGAKNEALQVICAVLLTDQEVRISNIPDIVDVRKLIELLAALGVRIERIDAHTYTFRADALNLDFLRSDESREKAGHLRGSIMTIGPLLTRFGFGAIPSPGGDKIGRRRLDTHFIGFEKLGASFDFDPDTHFYTVSAKKLVGTYILLEEASVTGTANIVMAASMALGTTQIYNAACEPYIQQLCKMLNGMGAVISGIGSNLLTIKGVDKLHGVSHRILPDMVEIGSLLVLRR